MLSLGPNAASSGLMMVFVNARTGAFRRVLSSLDGTSRAASTGESCLPSVEPDVPESGSPTTVTTPCPNPPADEPASTRLALGAGGGRGLVP